MGAARRLLPAAAELAAGAVLFVYAAAAQNCCPEDNVYVKHSMACAGADGWDKLHIQNNLSCTLGMYTLDPTEHHGDTFRVLEDGRLQTGGNESTYTVEPGGYCTTWLQVDQSKSPRKVAFVCFPEEELEEDEFWWSCFGALEVISTFFSFITLCVYVLIHELRDLQGRCIMSTVFCQLLGYLFLAIIHLVGSHMSPTPCIASAFTLYFWMLASFFWLTVISFNVWRAARYKRFPLTDTQLFVCYSAFGWLCPLAFLVAALTTHHLPVTEDILLRPNFGLSKCWFDGDTETWAYFYGPISLLLACNVVFFVMTAVRLWRGGEGDNSVPGIRASRYKCLLYLRLFVIMGILWIFECISFLFKGYEGVWRVTDIINCLQGVFIFLIVVCRKRVVIALTKREWGRTLVTAVCPKRCTRGPDDEQAEAMISSGGDKEACMPMEAAAVLERT